MSRLLNLLPPQTCYLLFGFSVPFYFHYFLLALIFYKPLTFLIKNKYFRWFIIFLLPTIILVQLLRNGFFFQSDDFAHLKIAAEYSFGELFSRGMGRKAIWGFHHIFVGFWLFKTDFIFFKTKLEAYLLTNFFLHLLNLALFYKILEKIKKSPPFAVLATLLFGTFYLSWISNIHELIAVTFFLLGIFVWLSWLKLAKKKYLFSTFLFYLLAVCAKEITFVFPVILFLISIFWHNYVSKINFRKTIRTLAPFFAVLIVYFLTYGKVYLGFFRLTGDGYRAAFSLTVFLKNLLVYLTKVIPIINNSVLNFLVFLLILIGFDLWKRKPLLLPFLFSYLILIAPAAFFERKIALYYAYIPSIFLYLAFFVFLADIYSLGRKIFENRRRVLKIYTIYFGLIVLLGIFRLNKFFMDNCFLIQFPWENPHRVALDSLSEKLNKLFKEGKINEWAEIKLTEDEATHEMKSLFTTNALYLFLEDKNSVNYTFVYNEDKNSLTVKEESSYHQIAF